MNKWMVCLVIVLSLPVQAMLQERSFFERNNLQGEVSYVYGYGLEELREVEFIAESVEKGNVVIVSGPEHFSSKGYTEGILDTEEHYNLACGLIKNMLWKTLSENQVFFFKEKDLIYLDYFKRIDEKKFKQIRSKFVDKVDLSTTQSINKADSVDRLFLIQEFVDQYNLPEMDSLMLVHNFFKLSLDRVLEVTKSIYPTKKIIVVFNDFGYSEGKKYLESVLLGMKNCYFFLPKKGSYNESYSSFRVRNKIKNHKSYEDYDIIDSEDLPRKLKFSKSVIFEREVLLNLGVKFIYFKELDNCMW
ncbi:hypothetical protein GCM10009118_34410 [Wandonia haliotis]|uniref:Uncharacterized protein n=1 Tax=Wandonia haliotis TaxID=574963 RepID=A0ABN1MUM2_9FLAO